MLGQIIWLIVYSNNHFDKIYYKWIIADVFLNWFGSAAYLVQLEKIIFE